MITSVIVLNYNDWQLTKSYVEKICPYDCINHIVIVDNCSTDESYDRLREIQSAQVDVVKTDANNGYAAGNNYGLRYVIQKFGKQGIAVISNPDIRISQKSFQTIVNSFREYPSQFAATGEVYNLSGKRIPLFTWKLPTYGILLANNSVVLRVLLKRYFRYGKNYTNLNQIEDEDAYRGEVLPGCFFAVDLEKMIEIGMFSESTFLYYEEEILFSKAKNKGYISRVMKNATLVHEEGATTKKNISSWLKRESFFEDSCIKYLQECLHIGPFQIFIHMFMNRLLLPERYVCEKIKTMNF